MRPVNEDMKLEARYQCMRKIKRKILTLIAAAEITQSPNCKDTKFASYRSRSLLFTAEPSLVSTCRSLEQNTIEREGVCRREVTKCIDGCVDLFAKS